MSETATERRMFAKRMRQRCKMCGEPFGVHGASYPHTRGDDCAGFKASDKTRPVMTPPQGDSR